ncbi:peptide MFS transporter [Govanella unica]|uniref:Peptide MFS transporter n=1 Tax=Govanella unica TaxID=2975056 RepID=A0A9X3Z637_9PROT|nr:peptide MFS transporter [Govania unica]
MHESNLASETLGHPRGLYVLAMTETWERFAYYGMRALLILYMTGYLLRDGVADHVLGLAALQSFLAGVFGPLSSQGLSSQIYGFYTGFVYLTPIFGGIIADRLMGQRRMVVIGALLMAAGQFLLMSEALFLPALLLLVLGNGCFKPNIVTQVGRLYGAGDARRDRAYSLFYVGINFGACVAPLACGTVAQVWGWRYGFGLSGVGMLVGLGIFLMGRRYLPPDIDRSARAVRAEADGDDRARIKILALIAVIMMSYWLTFEQLGNVFSLWMRDDIDRGIFGFAVPVAWFQSLNPMLMIVLTPLIVRRWSRQGKLGQEPTAMTKIMTGLVLTGVAYVMLAGLSLVDGQRVGCLAIIPFMFVLTWGELFISPTSLSLFSRVAPLRLISMMMGVYFLSGFFGSYLAGFLGSFWEAMPHARYWLMIAGIAFMAAMLILMLRRSVDAFLARRDISVRALAEASAG